MAGGVGLVAWKSGLGAAISDISKTPAATSTSEPVVQASTPPSTPTVRIEPTSTPHPTATLEPNSPPEDMVEETSISELRRAFDNGWFSIAEYTQAALDRIDAMDQQGPMLNAIIELNPDAMELAEELDREARDGRIRGPMHGVPVLVKDIFATGDQMKTTTGALALADNEVVADSFVIEALRDAGALILGKTNLTEFSNFRGGLPSGYSTRGGQTVNPYVLTHTAWGSSTGSAVAAAASYAPLTLGSETDGSILCPASACGVVGLKPTVGLVSRSGVLGISFTQDSPGPIGRTVEDVAYGLSAMVGYDPSDMAYGQFANFAPAARFEQNPVPDAGTVDYTAALDPDGLRGARIGVCRSMFTFDPIADAHMEVALDAMREAGAEVIDDIYMDAAGVLMNSGTEGGMLMVEFAWNFQNFIDTWMPGGPITSLADVINFNYEHWDATLSMGPQEGLEYALSATTIDDPWYQDLVAFNTATARDEGIDLVMDEHDLDALVAPTVAMPSPLWNEQFHGSSTQVASMAGYPSITVPIGFTNGLPAGMHLFGRAFSEETLLRLAYGLEQTIQIRQAPQYLEEEPMDVPTPTTGETPSPITIPSDGTGGG